MDWTIEQIHTIAILGGTGKEGKGLAYRWAKAGYTVIIGSRQIEKAQAAVNDLFAILPAQAKVIAATNTEAAKNCDLAVITVPFSAHTQILQDQREFLQGKIVIDVTVPLVPPKVTKVQMPAAGSASLEAQSILGDGAQVVAAFQNISYEHLLHDADIDCDVLVCGAKASRGVVLELVRAAGLVGIDAGPLENSVIPEGLTSILIGINKQFGIQNAGIRITGIPHP